MKLNKLSELTEADIMTELHKEFSQLQLDLAADKLSGLIATSETLEHLIARVYEVVNVEIEERQVKENKKINRLDTRKDNL